MRKFLAPISEEEVLEVMHPHRWDNLAVIRHHISQNRPFPHIATPYALPGASLLPSPIFRNLGVSHYTTIPNSLYFGYNPNLPHFFLLLQGLVLKGVLELRFTSHLPKTSYVNPPIDPDLIAKYQKEAQEIIAELREKIDACLKEGNTSEAEILQRDIQEIETYGYGAPYYRLKESGAIKKQTRKAVENVIPGVLTPEAI